MGLFTTLVAGPPPRAVGGTMVSTLAPSIMGSNGSVSTDAGPAVDGDRALMVGAAYAAINFIARTGATLPIRLQRRDDKSRAQVNDAEFAWLTRRPNGPTSRISFLETLFASIEGWGNGYAWIGRPAGKMYDPARPWVGVKELWHLRPQRLAIGTFDSGDKGFTLDGSREKPFTAREILHVPGFSIDGIRGLSPVAVGANALGLSIATERFGSLFFKNGSTLSGIITSEAVVTPTAAKELIEIWDDEHKGLNNAHLMGVLGGNAKYQAVGIPPNEAQFLETRIHQREEVLQFYGPIPHHLLGWKSNTSNFGTGIESQGIHVVVFVMLNRLKRVEEAIESQLLPPELEMTFNVNGLLQGDARTRAGLYQTLRNLGVMTADEIREKEDMAPRDIPDDYWQPLNIQRVLADGRPAPVPTTKPSGFPRQPSAMAEVRCPTCPPAHRALLAKNVVSADLWCGACKREAHIRDGVFVGAAVGAEAPAPLATPPRHDWLDGVDALVDEIGRRL